MPSSSCQSHKFESTSLLFPPVSPKTSNHWKSVFRFANTSSKKLSSNSPTLAVDTSFISNSTAHIPTTTPITATPSLTPSSLLSDRRSSYGSYNTLSSDSNGGRTLVNSRGPQTTSYSSYPPQQQSPKAVDLPFSKSRSHLKSDKQRSHLSSNPNSPRPKPLTCDPSQPSFIDFPGPPKSRSNHGPLSPKSMSASASRFLRRVASAPNIKGLFSLGSRSTSSTMKNGLLAPTEVVPPLPLLVSSSSEHGTNSLETMSSGSSRGVSLKHTPPGSFSQSRKMPGGSAVADGPARLAFRRTYSSNSIKVRQV